MAKIPIEPLFEKARNCNTDLLDFFMKVSKLKSKGDLTSIESTALKAIATVWHEGKQQELVSFEVEEVMWTIIENLFPKEQGGVAKLMQLRKTLYPSKGNPQVSVTPEVFRWLQEEAKLTLERLTDVSDAERKYWESVAKGTPPKGVQIVTP